MTDGATPASGSSDASAAFSGATGAGGSGAVASAAPNMIGDFFGVPYRRPVQVPTTSTLILQRGAVRTPLATSTALTTKVVVTDVAAGRGAFKISESESPRPVDRVFFNYNYYGALPSPARSSRPPSRRSIRRQGWC